MTATATVTVSDADYAKLTEYWAESKYYRGEAVALMRAWLKQHKGTEDVNAGLRQCTAQELYTLSDIVSANHWHGSRNWIYLLYERLSAREAAAAAEQDGLDSMTREMPGEADGDA